MMLEGRGVRRPHGRLDGVVEDAIGWVLNGVDRMMEYEIAGVVLVHQYTYLPGRLESV